MDYICSDFSTYFYKRFMKSLWDIYGIFMGYLFFRSVVLLLCLQKNRFINDFCLNITAEGI